MQVTDWGPTLGQPAWAFRNRIELLAGETIKSSASSIVLDPADALGGRVTVGANDPFSTINNSQVLVLRGGGYDTEATATSAGKHWLTVLARAFARSLLPADFGIRSIPAGGLTDYGRKLAEADLGVPVLNEANDLQVFPDVPYTRFASGRARASVQRSEEHIRGAMATSARLGVTQDDLKALLAYQMWSLAQDLPAVDARFVLLVTAIECFADPKPRSDDSVGLVESLRATVSASEISDTDKASLDTALKSLRQESIGQACRSVVRRLGDRTYDGESATRLFGRCYTLRSRVVHGSPPSAQDLWIEEPKLRQLVADLVQGGLLDALPQFPGLEGANDWLVAAGADALAMVAPEPSVEHGAQLE